ncbi:MAG: Gfo/Idh/MocA family oxidoreductase [Acidobacteria bacterium]|nr:Gfo/Idh/MocA family oxidoreductase [Acidobacteriota bacterium]
MQRRSLLKSAASALTGFPTIISATALGLNGAVAASDRVTIATVGVGWMGGSHVDAFLKIPQAQYVAVCDVDERHLTEAKAKIDLKYGNQGCTPYHAMEEVFLRRDIDAVSIALPDHWHGIAAVLALRAGKDVYAEKPLAHHFTEGRAIVEHMQKYNRIWQTGSWQRSRENFRKACELVRNGRIGKVTRCEVGLPGGHTDFAKTKDKLEFTAPPSTLNWDRWLGPAPEAQYAEGRVHKNWRWNLDHGGGQLMDWIGHHVDIAHWGLGFDATGPIEIEGVGEYPAKTSIWNSATKYRITARYKSGVEMVIAGGHSDVRGGTKWIGDKGWIWVNRNGLESNPAEVLTAEIGPGELHLPKSPGHYEEFIASVKTRARTLTPADVAFRSATPGWLGQIAMLTGRKLRFDPDKLEILNDAEATSMLSREMRPPYKL